MTVLGGAGVVAWPMLAQAADAWGGHQSVLRPISSGSEAVARLWWIMFWTSVVVYVLVIGYLMYGVMRRRRLPERDVVREEESQHRSMTRTVTIATAATAVILFVILFADFFTGRAIAAPRFVDNPLRLTVVGHQWWWEANYEDPMPQRRISVANEIHVPVGRTVVLALRSHDVIHSFWVPNLMGKSDLVPGYNAVNWFRADTPGVYRGQCAEFCGFQHAKMALLIIAEPVSKYNQWYAAQLTPASEPSDSTRAEGKRIFLAGPCATCHSIRGTLAGARTGPDLTHVGSSLTIGAGTLPNNRGNLAGWIVDPQRIKPGVYMPPNNLSPKQLRALLAYLEGLK